MISENNILPLLCYKCYNFIICRILEQMLKTDSNLSIIPNERAKETLYFLKLTEFNALHQTISPLLKESIRNIETKIYSRSNKMKNKNKK